MTDRFDVTVAGAGMVGAACACLFARLGLRVAVVESHQLESRTPPDGRVSAVNLASRQLLDTLDAWDDIDQQRVHPFRAMRVWDNNSDAKIAFSAEDVARKQLGYIVENGAIVDALVDRLRRNYSVQVFDRCSVSRVAEDTDSRGLRVEIGENELITGLLVGADGANSAVRSAADIGSRKSPYNQVAIVTTVTTSAGHAETAWQCFLETGPVAMLPLGPGKCSIVWSCDDDFADEVLALDSREFCDRLETWFSPHLGRLEEVDTRRHFPLARRHAESYIARRIALVGDAAHTIHPLAGLGANLGFLDAAALAQVVGDAIARGRHPGATTVLRRYERWRQGENAAVLAAMNAFKSTFGSSRPEARLLRSAGMNLANRTSLVRKTLALLATGIEGDLPEACQPRMTHAS